MFIIIYSLLLFSLCVAVEALPSRAFRAVDVGTPAALVGLNNEVVGNHVKDHLRRLGSRRDRRRARRNRRRCRNGRRRCDDESSSSSSSVITGTDKTVLAPSVSSKAGTTQGGGGNKFN